jgi:protein-disulfide isomerase
MNENELNVETASDAEVLEGVRKHMSSIEPLVPPPPAGDWYEAAAGKPRRTVIRSRIGFAGLAPLVLVVAVVTVAVGVNLGRGGGSGSKSTYGVGIEYQLQPAAGQQVSDADMEATRTIIAKRLSAAGMDDSSINPALPDKFTVTVMGTTDIAAVTAVVGQAGKLEFVPLPPETYGIAGNVGAVTPLPAIGDPIDPSLPVLLDGSRLDPDGVAAQLGTTGSWEVAFLFDAQGAAVLASWSSAHVNEYFAIVLDGKVLSVPYLQSAIQDGAGVIAGASNESEARNLAAILKSGAVPVPFVVVSAQILGQVSTNPIAPSATIPPSIPASGKTLGNANAPHTIDVYEDFQCPLCKNFTTDVQPVLVANYVATGKAKIVFHDYVVIDQFTGGTESLDAANAAMCAADQGRFWPYHDWLFANQGSEGSGAFTKDRLKVIGAAAGIPDLTTFNSCVDGGTHDADIATEQSQLPSGVLGVPAVIIDGGPPLASYDYETISAVLNQIIGASPNPVATPGPTDTSSPSAMPQRSDVPTATATP